EICPEAVEHARKTVGPTVHQGDFLKAEVDKKYDVVCMFDCIEHLAMPQKFIEKISSVMRSGGHLSITTGDIGTMVPKIRGKKWRLVHPPTHVHYFSFDSLKALLEKNGFKI